MRLPPRSIALALGACLFLTAPTAHALIVFGLDHTGNQTAPPNGAPWDHVARAGGGTGIYLGHGFVLAAGHFNLPDSIILGGIVYQRDMTFAEVRIEPRDLRVFKIVNPPALLELALTSVLDDDLEKDCTLIGTGRGKGAPITPPPESGWLWGADTTRARRWGLNRTLPAALTLTDPSPFREFIALEIKFEELPDPASSEAVNEAALATGDSGSGLFIEFGGTWKLAGINTDVTSGGKSLYVPEDSNYAVRLREYSHLLRFASWGAAHLGTTSPAEDGDPDGDGIPHLLEYFLGLNPAASDAQGAPVVATEGTDLAFTYTQLASATDVSFAIEESADLTGPWTPAAVSSSQVLATNGVIRTVKALVPMGSGGMKFLRLRVTRF